MVVYSEVRYGLISLLMPTVLCISALGQTSTKEESEAAYKPLKRLLEVAQSELVAAEIPAAEVKLRLSIVKNVATVKAYFPHADGGRPETRNSKYWTQNDDGYYVPLDKPTEAIKDLWRTTSGIRCHKLSTLVMLKGLIDVSTPSQIASLDDLLRDKVIPTDLQDEGIGTLFDWQRKDEGYSNDGKEFLVGDQIWFDNPYFDQLNERQQSRYRGQEGHHVFYIGGGKVIDMYSRVPEKIDDFRESFLSWGSVKTIAKRDNVEPTIDDFVVKEIRRVLLQK